MYERRGGATGRRVVGMIGVCRVARDSERHVIHGPERVGARIIVAIDTTTSSRQWPSLLQPLHVAQFSFVSDVVYPRG